MRGSKIQRTHRIIARVPRGQVGDECPGCGNLIRLRERGAGNGGIVATVIGQSGAWRAIANDIAARGHTVTSPRDLVLCLAYLKETRQAAIDAHRAYTMRAVQDHSARIAHLSSEPRWLRRFLNGFEIASLRSTVSALYATDSQYPGRLDQTIRRVEGLLGSAELAGAAAELEVIDQLRLLPDSFTVFNDVRLRATRHIYFDGASIKSAQLDHVVVGPNGVFVVETKHWSRRFVESGDYHNPFDQARRANYLCFDLLRQRFGKTPVRGVIACLGSLPPSPDENFLKVVRSERLCGHITNSGKTEFGPERTAQLREFFAARVTSA